MLSPIILGQKQKPKLQGVWHSGGNADIDPEDLIRFDLCAWSLNIVSWPDDTFYAPDGHRSDEKGRRSDGAVMFNTVEWPRHEGQVYLGV